MNVKRLDPTRPTAFFKPGPLSLGTFAPAANRFLDAVARKDFCYGGTEHRDLCSLKEIRGWDSADQLVAAMLSEAGAAYLMDAEGPMREAVTKEMLPFFQGSFDWQLAGFPHFELSDDFFHSIALTDFGDSGEEPLLMPFHSFTIGLPTNHLLPMRHLFVQRQASVIAHPPRPGEGGSRLDIAFNGLRLTLGTPAPAWSQWELGMTKRDFISVDLPWMRGMKDGFALGQVLAFGGRSQAELEAELDNDQRYLLTSRRLLCNLITYIDTHGGLPTLKHEHKAPPAAVERIHRERPIFRVGRPIKLSPGIRNALKGAGVGDSWKLAQRHIVRGHWRNQAHGPGMTLRRRQHIEPYWKGPKDFGEALERTYVVE